MTDHARIADHRNTTPRPSWDETHAWAVKEMGYEGQRDTLKSAHNRWLARRAQFEAHIPPGLPRWNRGPERDHELAYTHGALWVDFGSRGRAVICAGLDLHVGTAHHNPRAVAAMLEWVEEHDAYFVLAGDLTDNSHLSKHGAADQVLTFDGAVDQACEELRGFEHRLLLITIGNHDARTQSQIGADPARAVARELGVPYCPGPCLVSAIVGGHMEPGYVSHGAGGGKSRGYLRTYAFRPFDLNSITWAIQGHLHRPYADAEVTHVIDPATGERRWGRWVGLVAGSAHRYAGYVERGGYAPALLGTSFLTITPDGIPSQDEGGYGVVQLLKNEIK